MLGCSVANKTVFSSAIEDTIVPILSTSSSYVSSNTCCLGSTISSSSCTKVEATYVGICKSWTSIVALRIGVSTLLSLVCEVSTCCSKRGHLARLSVGLETEWTLTLFSSNCTIGWLFWCLKLSFRSWEWPQEDWDRYFVRKYCDKYSSWSFAFPFINGRFLPNKAHIFEIHPKILGSPY